MLIRGKWHLALILALVVWLTLIICTETKAQTLVLPVKTVVTAYCHWGYTASGTYTTWGSVAASSRIPFGTQVWIDGYGYGTVQDRGGYRIENGALDVWFASCYDAIQWGVRTVDVFYW